MRRAYSHIISFILRSTSAPSAMHTCFQQHSTSLQRDEEGYRTVLGLWVTATTTLTHSYASAKHRLLATARFSLVKAKNHNWMLLRAHILNNSKLETIKRGCQSRKIYGIQETTILQETFFRLALKNKAKWFWWANFLLPLILSQHTHAALVFYYFISERLRNAESIRALGIDALSFRVTLIIREECCNNKPITCFWVGVSWNEHCEGI